MFRDHYDYIVVGAGSAGCALANRLSRDPSISVLLIESGPPDDHMLIHMPRGLGVILNPGSRFIWDYRVQTGSNQRPERWYRGRTIGGSSSVNGMVYMRGAPLDYDGWAAAGCQGWGWTDIGPKFKALEDHDQGAAEWRGVGGPLRVTTFPERSPLCEAILDAAGELGLPRVDDVNSIDAVRDGGLGYQPSTTWRGKRFSAARAFIAPARDRPNLQLVTGTDVLRIEFDGKRATGVRVRGQQGERSVRARRETILCAGAIETPKLLQLSGLGPGELLKTHGIEIVVDAPSVGRNLREHRYIALKYRVRGGSQNGALGGFRALWSMLRYLTRAQGPMTHAAHEIGGFAKSEPGLDHADLQFGSMLLTASDTGKNGKVALDPFPGITLLGYFTRPESEGEVRIQSADPKAQPYVNANHLTAEIDRRKFVAVFHWLRALARQQPLRDWIVEETFPAELIRSDDDILVHALSLGGTCFHTAGTARMGADERSVVDPRLRVRGVTGLRVADTSIMPTLVSGNTNAPAMVIGLRAADFILADNAA